MSPQDHVQNLPGPSSLATANKLDARAPLLPFRRISLPTLPAVGLLNRQSVVSLVSVDSLPEEDEPSHFLAPPIVPSSRKSLMKSPISLESRRSSRKRDTQHIDEAKAAKRRRIVEEFYETERAYVDGLDLIYSVCSLYLRIYAFC